jgi:hypothetical protein
MTKVADRRSGQGGQAAESATYMRYPLLITERGITIRTPDGLFVDTVASMKTARLVVRGYRRAERDEA